MHERPIRIAVVMACYNRRETTLRCLRSLMSQAVEGAILSVHLLDDASSDGTSTAVKAEFPEVTIISGDGRHFWGGGMYAAMQSALCSDFDYMLWLNDDVTLRPNALANLLDGYKRACTKDGSPLHVISGPVQDPMTGALTYSGFNRKNAWHPAQLNRVSPEADRLTQCDTLNGNCVLVPKAVVERVGLIDPVFIQQLGDIDYGYRVQRAGGHCWVSPEFVGVCASNPSSAPQRNWSARFRRMLSPHGLPLRPWVTFMWRYAGFVGVFLLCGSYAKWMLRARA